MGKLLLDSRTSSAIKRQQESIRRYAREGKMHLVEGMNKTTSTLFDSSNYKEEIINGQKVLVLRNIKDTRSRPGALKDVNKILEGQEKKQQKKYERYKRTSKDNKLTFEEYVNKDTIFKDLWLLYQREEEVTNFFYSPKKNKTYPKAQDLQKKYSDLIAAEKGKAQKTIEEIQGE